VHDGVWGATHKFGIADIEQVALRLGGDATHRFDDLGSRQLSTLAPTFNGNSTNLYYGVLDFRESLAT
jgi:hypothetical protein